MVELGFKSRKLHNTFHLFKAENEFKGSENILNGKHNILVSYGIGVR